MAYSSLTIAILVTCDLFTFLAILSVVVRFWTRNTGRIPLKADDWVIIPVLVCSLSFLAKTSVGKLTTQLSTLATCACGTWGMFGPAMWRSIVTPYEGALGGNLGGYDFSETDEQFVAWA